MRDEDEIQKMADRAASILSNGVHSKGAVEYKGRVYDADRLRGIVDALDWVLDEDTDPPV